MSFITDFFTESGGKSNQQQYVNQATNTNTTGGQTSETGSKQKTSGTQQTTEQTGQQQSTTTKLFSPEEEAALKNVLSGIINQYGAQGGTVPQEFLNTISQANTASGALNTRAQSAETDLSAQFAPIISEARRSGEKQIATGRTQLANAAGSTLDSGVVGATAEAQAQLESQLASLGANLNINARQIGTDERTKAITALLAGGQAGGELSNLSSTAGVGNIAEISNLLRGATSKQETTGQVTSEQNISTQQLVEALQNMFTEYNQQVASSTSGTTTGSKQTTQHGSLLDALNGIGGLVSP